MFPTLRSSFAALLAFTLVGATTGHADDPPKKDDALDRLLEKLDESPAPPAPGAKAEKPDAAKPDPAPAKADPTKAKPAGEDEKAPGDVAPKDQALDSLLEKLGETKDRPDARDERRPGGRPMPDKDQGEGEAKGKEPMPPKTDQPDPGDLTGRDKNIDERLEELTGRKRKKKGQDEEESGPLSQVIKEMREVEQRLGKPDTGDETRKKQTEIVKNLDQLIEQLKNASAQMKGQKKTRLVNMPGPKPGSQQPGQTPGTNPGHAPNMKPAKPDGKHALVNGKDEWGHLPPELRQEMNNVEREVMLPSMEELIKRYYLSVSKKSLVREE
jgi:hypothetical protein